MDRRTNRRTNRRTTWAPQTPEDQRRESNPLRSPTDRGDLRKGRRPSHQEVVDAVLTLQDEVQALHTMDRALVVRLNHYAKFLDAMLRGLEGLAEDLEAEGHALAPKAHKTLRAARVMHRALGAPPVQVGDHNGTP